jgi:two-component system response regulator YesN
MKTMTDIKQPAIFQAAEDDIILNLFKRCVEEYEAKKKHFDRLLEQYVNEIWIRLIRTPVKGQHKREPHKVAHAKAYMLSNYNKAIGRQDIAHHVDVTPEHLNYLFKTFCADTPMNFLTQLRIRKAKELLRRANLNVSQVAFFTGFTDPLYFSRVFRKYVGLSPRTFANQI